MLGTGGYTAAEADLGEPEALKVFLGQGHGGVEADDGEVARHMENGADHRFAKLGDEIIQLGRIVPGRAGAVVAVVDIADTAAAVIHMLEDHRGVCSRPVAVLDAETDVGRG